MMFCEKCGTKILGAFCTKCGEERPLSLPQVDAAYDVSKYCSACGKPVTAAYCVGCGNPQALNVTFGKASVFGGVAVGGGMPMPNGGSAAAGVAAMPIPMEWCLMGIVLLFALSTMTLFGGLMLISVLIPGAVYIFDRELYAKLKLFLNVGVAGLGLVFAVLATFSGTVRLSIFAFLLCILGLGLIALFGIGGMLKLPGEVGKILAFDESPMYFYLTALYFAFVTVFLRIVIIIEFFSIREVISEGIGVGRVFFLMIIVLVMLLPPAVIAFMLWRGINRLMGVLLIALGVAAVFAAIVLPLFLWRELSVPLLDIITVPLVYIILGYGGVALTGLLLFFQKDLILKTFGAGPGSVNT